MSYFSNVGFGTTMLAHGLIPEWVPFQSMGYPFLLNPQSGVFYPPFWAFAVVKAQYTLHAATAMQALHVGFAAFGMYRLARIYTRRWQVALLAAIAYHFFGAFFSNAQHPDIIRAYAWLPWLFWVATPDREQSRLVLRNMVAPLVVLCAITGSYPGNFVSHFFLLGIYGLVLLSQTSERLERFRLTSIFALVALGIVLSIPMWLPSWEMRSHFLTRSGGDWPRNDWDARNWPSLLFPWGLDGYVGDLTMRSAYVGATVMMLVLLSRRSNTHAFRSLSWWVVLITAFALLPGASSPVYESFGSVLSPLKLSRNASSDYRGLVGLSLIVLGVTAFDSWIDLSPEIRRRVLKQRIVWAIFAGLLFFTGQWPVVIPFRHWFFALAIFTATIAVLLGSSRRYLSDGTTVSIVTVLMTLNGVVVAWAGKNTWHVPHAIELYRTTTGVDSERPLLLNERISAPPTRRPPRVPVAENTLPNWWGSLNGTYQMSDIGGFVLQSRNMIEADPTLIAWMKEGSSTVSLPPKSDAAASCEELKARLVARNEVSPDVQVARYGINSIEYEVHLRSPAIVVENEVFFPGWKARIQGQRDSEYRSTPVCKALRGWSLPAGDYRFVTSYRTPYLRLSTMIAFAALLLYLIIIGAKIFRRGRVVLQLRKASAAQQTLQ